MPPPSFAWRPNGEESRAILRWIEGGMPDATGERALSPSWLAQTLGVEAEGPGRLEDATCHGAQEEVTFWGTHRRYLSSFDILRFLERKFRPSRDNAP